MAKDALLTQSVLINAPSPWVTATTYVSPTITVEPFSSNGTHSTLWGRFILSQPTFAAIPVASGTYNWHFHVAASKDGNTWTQVSSSPTDADAFKTHMVYIQGSLAISAQSLTIPHNVNVTASPTFTNGNSAIPAAPYAVVGDVFTFAATATPFATSTPYYVVSSTPVAAAATAQSNITLSATPGGAPITFTGTTGAFSISKVTPVPIAVGDTYQIKGTFTAGLDGVGGSAFTIVDGQNIVVTRVSNTGVATSVFFRVAGDSTNAGTQREYVQGAAASTSVSINYNNGGGEVFLPLVAPVGLQTNMSGVQQDNYKYVRFSAVCTFSGTAINPTATVRCDLVTSRDGSYS
jgi:hypothetical protein